MQRVYFRSFLILFFFPSFFFFFFSVIVILRNDGGEKKKKITRAKLRNVRFVTNYYSIIVRDGKWLAKPTTVTVGQVGSRSFFRRY